MKKITFQEAKEMSIKRWTEIVEHGESITPCGFCELDDQKQKQDTSLKDCETCSFSIACYGHCLTVHNPYSIWSYRKTKENALKVLEAVKRCVEQ